MGEQIVTVPRRVAEIQITDDGYDVKKEGNDNMGMNPKKLIQMQMAWKKFNDDHPKVLPFLKAVEAAGIREGTVIEVAVETPEGEKYESNIRVRQSDLDLLKSLKEG